MMPSRPPRLDRRVSRALPLGLVLLGAACGGSDPKVDVEDLHGHLTADLTLRGHATVTGDLFVDPGVTLTVAPGTEVVIMADQDVEGLSHIGGVDDLTTGDPTNDPAAGGDAYEQTHISILVQGAIRAEGTAAAPIRFVSSSDAPSYTDWVGFVVKQGTFRFVEMGWCRDCLYSDEHHRGFVIEDSRIEHAWAACVGFQQPADATAPARIVRSFVADCGHEAIDTHSPGTIEVGHNRIETSQVGINLHDAMQASLHHNIIVATTIPIITVGAVDVFATQNVIQAQTQDASRWTYDGWTMPTLSPPCGIAVMNDPNASVVVTNSIFFDSPAGMRSDAPEGALSCGYNNMDNVDVPYGGSALAGAGALSVDAGFVDKAAGDFHLGAASLMRGAGNPADGSPDLGAYGGL